MPQKNTPEQVSETLLEQKIRALLSRQTYEVLIHDPYGLGYAAHDTLNAEYIPVLYPDSLTGRKHYDTVRNEALLAVFHRERWVADDLFERLGAVRLDFRLHTLLECHPVLDELLEEIQTTPGWTGWNVLEQRQEWGRFNKLSTRVEVLARFSSLYFSLPESAGALLERLGELHAAEEGLLLTPLLREGLLERLGFLLEWGAAELGFTPEGLLSASGHRDAVEKLFQLGFRTGTKKAGIHPELKKLADTLNTTGGTRVLAGFKAEARMLPREQWLQVLRSKPSPQLARALLEQIYEDALKAGRSTPELAGALKAWKKKVPELEAAFAAAALLECLHVPAPERSSAPSAWLELARVRVKLDLAFHALPKDWRETLAPAIEDLCVRWDYEFSHYIERHYPLWMRGTPRSVATSADIVAQVYDPSRPTYLLVFDGMALDQWEALKPLVLKAYGRGKEAEEQLYFSLLPSATPYARNALFSGLTPAQMVEAYGAGVLDGNHYEEKMLQKRYPGARYLRVADSAGNKPERKRMMAEDAPLKAFVFNKMDDLIHARNLGDDRQKARDLLLVEFKDSPMLEVIEHAGREDAIVLITSDHGNQLTRSRIRFSLDGYPSEKPEVAARYAHWHGRLRGKPNPDLLEPSDPGEWGLPSDLRVSLCRATHRLSSGDGPYLAHGGVSLLECIIPMIVLK